MPVPEPVLFDMRGGAHPDPVMNAVELQIAEEAWKRITGDPTWEELHPRTAYNFIHLNTFYGTQNVELVKLLYRLQPYPFYLEGEVTGKCGLRCQFCEHTYWKEPVYPDWTTEQFKYIIDQFPELHFAAFNPIADQFLNRDFFEMMKYLDDKNIPQELYTTTFFLQESDMKKFVDLKSLLMVKFSFDAATADTYEKLRVGINFDKVVRNIKALDKYKRQAHRFFPRIEFHYILTKANIHEAEKFLDFLDSLEIRVHEVMFSRMLHYFPEIKDLYTEIPQELVNKLIQKGQSLGINVITNANVNPTFPACYCTDWLMPFVFVDGSVIPCCSTNEANRRPFQRQNSLGNIFEKPFREIWWDKPYRTLRNMLWNKQVSEHPICKDCVILNTKV